METYVKQNVDIHEYKMHKHVYDLNIVNIPEIISYNEETKTLVMKKINNMNISDMYGEEACNVSSDIFAEIRKIIKKLYENDIEYPDITGYNFIDVDDKVWIIDFEHSKIINNLNKSKKSKHPFIKKFINGLNEWNPEFK